MSNGTDTGDTPIANDTIINMITNFQPRITSEYQNLDENRLSSQKRSLSLSGDSSSEQFSPLKRQRFEQLKTSYTASPRETRRLKMDLMEARNTIMCLENRIEQLHSVRKELQQVFENETADLRQKHKFDTESIKRLEAEIESVREREAKTREQLTDITHKYQMLKLEHCKEIENLEKQLEDGKERSSIEDEENKTEIVTLRRKFEQMEVVLEAAQQDADAHKQLVEELKSRLSEKNEIERELEMKKQELRKAQLQIKDLEFDRETYLEFKQQYQTQQHKLSTYSDLERENQHLKEECARLKEEVRNKLLLEEEVYDVKNRLVNFKEHEKKLTTLQIANTQNELQLEEWRTVARGICETTGLDSSLPHMLRKVVERLQQQEINLTADKVQLESQLNAAVHEAQLARSELEKNQKHLTELQLNVQQRQNLIHRLQKKLLLISRERDSYRLQLDSYERDLTVTLTPQSGAQTNSQQQSQKERIERLERIIDSYRDMIAKLENDLQNAEPAAYEDTNNTKAEQLKELQEEVRRLQSENNRLRQRNDQLEIQLENYLVGEDKAEGRIVHNENNPLAECLRQRSAETEKLKEEVERLKRKIKNMEEGLEGSKLADLTLCAKDAQALKEQIKTLESQNQRLKDFFKSSTQEFRNVTNMLLGYKIDRMTNSQYKLTSMYAESKDDYICFQLNPDGALNLLETRFSAALETFVDLHLRQQKSIPVFLSAITIDLFSNRTMTTETIDCEDD